MEVDTTTEPPEHNHDFPTKLKEEPAHEEEASSQQASTGTISTASHSEGEEDSHETTTAEPSTSPIPAAESEDDDADKDEGRKTATLAYGKEGVEEGPRFMEAMAPMMTAPVVALTSEERRALTSQLKETQQQNREKGVAKDESPSASSAPQKVVDWSDPRSTKVHLQALVEKRTQPFQDEIRAMYRNQHPHGNGPRSMLLLSAPSGSGKRRLAESSLRELVEQDGEGFYLEGHYDSLRRPIPYGGLVQAFSYFTRMVVARGLVEDMRQAIYSNLGTCADVSVLTSMIPELDGIIGCSEVQNEDGSYRKNKNTKNNDDPIQRFIFAFRMFVRAVTAGGRPLVLVLHDLHYADPCSLDILAGITTDRHNRGLFFFVGTCDDNKVTPSSYLALKLREMEDTSCLQIHNISLQPLQLVDGEQLRMWLIGALQMDPNKGHDNETSARLSRLVLANTKGNWFLVVELIQWLQESDLLCFDKLNQRWVLSTPEELDVVLTNNGGSNDFLTRKLEQQLSHENQQVLKASACLGCALDIDLLELLLDYPLNKTLQDLHKRGLLAHSKSGERSGIYAFAHDEIREASYRLIPDPELFHLEIGRRLWRKLSADALEENLFTVLSQMYAGRRLINREKERVAVATLCLHAGKKAAKSSTFRMAALYLQMGLDSLTCPQQQSHEATRCWHDTYELTLSLYCSCAEMTMSCGNFDETHQLLEPVFQNAKTFEDKLQAYSTKMYALSQQDRAQECIDLGISVLRRLGETFPIRLCYARLLSEMNTVGKLLKNKSNEQICRMQTISDTNKLHALQILNFMVLPCITFRPKLSAFVFLKMTKITMQHGLSVFASGAFGTYGMLYISATCDAEKGARFGDLSLLLLEQFGIMSFLPRAYAAVYGCIHAWTKPIQGALEPLLHSYRVGMSTGDPEYGGLCANLYCFYAFDSGVKLDIIRREYNSMKESLMTAKQAYMLRMFLPTMQTIHHFMGLSDDPLSMKGDLLDLEAFAENVSQKGSAMGELCLKVNKMVMGYMFGNLKMAEENTLTFAELMETPPTFERVAYLFYIGLIAIAAAREGRNYRKNVQTAKQVEKWMMKIGRSSPHNGLHKWNLIQAELASLLGKKAEAYEKYMTAVALAQETNHLFIKALANELFARHLLRIGDDQSRLESKTCYERSVAAYQEWGGVAKVTRLQEEARRLFGACDDYDERRRFDMGGMGPGSSRSIKGRDVEARAACSKC